MVNRRQFLAGMGAALFSAAAAKSVRAAPEDAVRSVDRAAADILHAINARLQSLPEGETLFVPIGEYHPMPAHTLVIQGVLQKLRAQGTAFAFGYESAHDTYAGLLAADIVADSRRKDEWFFRLASHDPHGHNMLRRILREDLYYGSSNETNMNLFRHCLADNISVSFNDLPSAYGAGRIYLDEQSLSVRWLAQWFGAGEQADVLSRNGMMMRNAAMVLGSMRHAVTEKSRIYIQQCGAYHLVGNEQYGMDYNKSLFSLYTQMGQAALPVDLAGHDKSYTAEMAAAMRANGLVIPDIDRTEFRYGSLSEKGRMRRKQDERNYMASLAAGSDIRLYEPAGPHLVWGQAGGSFSPAP